MIVGGWLAGERMDRLARRWRVTEASVVAIVHAVISEPVRRRIISARRARRTPGAVQIETGHAILAAICEEAAAS